MAGYEVTWNEVSSTTIPEFVVEKITRGLFGTHRGSFVDIPGRAGSWYFPDQRGRRRIMMECYILATGFPAPRRDALTRVADWLDIGAEARLILGDDPTVYYNAVLTDPPDVNEWRQLGRFQLEFVAEPYSYDLDATSETYEVDNDEEWTDNFDLLSATYPIIEVTNRSGSTKTGFTLTVNGSTINYVGSIADDATVTINSIGMAVLAGANDDVMLTGVYEPTDMLMTGVTGSFPILQQGVNSFEINAEPVGGSFEVQVTYRKRYRN